MAETIGNAERPRGDAARGDRLRRAGIASVVVVGVLLAGVGALFQAFVADEQAALDELSEATTMHRLLDDTVRLTVDGETAERGFVLTSDARFLRPLEGARAALPERLDTLGRILAAKYDDASAHALREAVEARLAWTEETVAMAERGDTSGARERIATREGIWLTDRIRDLARDIGDREDRNVSVLEARVDRSRGRLQLAFFALVVIAVALLGLFAQALAREVRQLRASSARAEESERRFRSIAESASDLVRIHRRDGSVVYVSPSCATLLGYTQQEMLAQPAFTFLPEADRARVQAVLARMFATDATSEPIRHGLRHRDGSIRAFDTRIDLAHDEDGNVIGYHTIGRDISDRVVEEQRLAERATKDALTGLSNAGAFAEEGAALLARCERDAKRALLAFCDVNGLKVINDELGHDAGDGVIVDTATLLRTIARDADLVARIGGDEFVVLGMVPDESGAEAFSRRLGERVQAHNEAAGRAYRVSLSVGTAVFRPGEGTTLEALRAEADAAMYKQKRARRGDPTTASGESLVREARAPQGK